MNNKNQKKRVAPITPSELIRWAFLAPLSVIFFASLSYLLSKHTCLQIGTLGQFGDFFGGILNPLCSLMSLIFIAKSLKFTWKAFEASLEANEVALEQVKVAFKQLEDDHERYTRDLKDGEIKSRRDLTIKWHQNWMSPEMSLLKRNAFGEIQTRIFGIETGQASAYMGGLRNANAVQVRKTYYEIKDVMNLIHHAITFFENELIDRELFLRLFETDFRQWQSALSRLDMRIHVDDLSLESAIEETERKELLGRMAKVVGTVSIQ